MYGIGVITLINGIINVYKEKGFTSHDVVAKLRGILKQKKIGHTGTLDPDAVGVLPVCLGKGTRLCDMLTEKDKQYEAVMLLGQVTDTQDTSGTVLSQKQVTCTENQIKEVIESFIGEYDQIPPMYSALKVNGKKLYELAREGIEIERKSRKVHIDSIQIGEINPSNLEGMIEVKMTVDCSKGTYIRTLCHDIGEKLGCGGCMKELKRTKVSRFTLDNSYTLKQIEEIVQQGELDKILTSIDTMFSSYEKVVVAKEFHKLIYNGNAFYLKNLKSSFKELSQYVRVYDEDNQFIGIYQYVKERKAFQVVKMFY